MTGGWYRGCPCSSNICLVYGLEQTVVYIVYRKKNKLSEVQTMNREYQALRNLKRKGTFDMEEATTYFVYEVHSDIDENNLYAEFDTETEAIEYAKSTATEENPMWVDKVEYDNETDEFVDYEEVWSSYDE